jgi:hypothetical protein
MSSAAQIIELTDLRAPVLSPLQKVALQATSRRPVTLTREAVLDAARAATRLEDFGALDFLPRLDCWMQATNEDANASPLARTNVWQLAVRCAANRLRLEDFIRRHPQVDDVVIEKPIVVAGTPRSGTTFMLELLGADPRFRALRWWEALFPIPGPADAPTAADANPRRTRAQANWRAIENLLPHQRLMHAFSADHIAEDIDLHVLNFSSYMLEWSAYVPRWRDYYLAEDQRSTYRYAKRAMQVLSYLRGPTRWVLKCPQHMEQLAVLADVFPDASFVLTHRDPVGSIRSAMVMSLYTARIFRTQVDYAEPLGYWPDRYRRMLSACVRDRDALPADRTLDVFFSDWISNSDAVLRDIYRQADLPITDEQLRAMHASSAEHHRKSTEKLVYDLERDFGVTAAELRAPFGFYFDRFPVRPEVG